MRALLIALATIVTMAPITASAAETKFDIINAVVIPNDAKELMVRVDAVTRRVCGDNLRTLYYRSCSDDVNAFIKASISVEKKRAFQAQRRADPSRFTNTSYRVF